MNIAQNMVVGHNTRQSATGYHEFAVMAEESSVPKEFVAAFVKLCSRLVKRGALRDPALLDFPRADPAWSAIANELLGLKNSNPERARVMVIYALTVASIKVHEHCSSEYLGTKTEMLTAIKKLSREAHQAFDGLFPDSYEDYGDFVSALENSTNQSMIDAANHARSIQNKLIALGDYSATQKINLDKLKAKAIVTYAKHRRAYVQAQFRIGFNLKSARILFERIWFGKPNKREFEAAIALVESQFENPKLISRIIMRAQ